MSLMSSMVNVSVMERSMIKTQPIEENILQQIELKFGDVIHSHVKFISFCPLQWQSLFFAACTSTDIHIFKVPIADDNLEHEVTIVCSHICSFNIQSPVVSLSWSPETSINHPVKVVLVCSLEDGGLKLCSWTGDTSTAHINSVKVANQFSSNNARIYQVNDVHIDPIFGELWASAGDDNVLNIYDAKGELKDQRLLRTSGRMVRFLHDKALMVIELGGTMRFYDGTTFQPIKAQFAHCPPIVKLDCVDTTIACINASGGLYIYSNDSNMAPREFKNPSSGTVALKLSPCGPWLAVADFSSFRIIHIDTGCIIKEGRLNAIRDVCWHPQRPLLTVAFENQVCILRLQ